MSVVSLDIPNSMSDELTMLSRSSDQSVEQFILQAVREKISVEKQQTYLKERGEAAEYFDLESFKKRIPDVEAGQYDQ